MVKRKARREHMPPMPRVTLGYVRPGGDRADVKAAFMACAIRTLLYELATTGTPYDAVDQQCASGQLVDARNSLVEHFLNTPIEWLWCVDSDMTFEADCVSRLLASADKDERPVMGALCFALKLGETEPRLMTNKFSVVPTIYTWNEITDDTGKVVNVGFTPFFDYPKNTIVKVDATGGACFVVHRSVLERIREQCGPVWFNRLEHPDAKMPFGEDVSFFARCAQVGVPVHIDTGVQTGHIKGGVDITEEWYDANRAS